MRQFRFHGFEERLLLKALIERDLVCRRLVSRWDGRLFESDDSNLIASWCVDYYEKYREPPGNRLMDLYRQWVEKSNPVLERQKAIENLLRDLLEERLEANDDYILDLAGAYFNRVRLSREWEAAKRLLDEGDVEGAYERVVRLRKVELGEGAVIKPGEDYEVWWDAFNEDRQESLVWYQGELENFLSKWLIRDSFYAFMGPDKVGKSMWLLDLAYRAVKGRRRVAYFEVGDMGRDGVIERLAARCTGLPLYGGKEDGEWVELEWPIGRNEEGKLLRGVKRVKGRLTPGRAFESFRRLCRGRDLMRISCHPNGTISVNGVRSILADWERDRWVPDVVVIDYADILAPPEGVKDPLEQIDETWKRLRRMSQELHCLVVTATQSSALAYKSGDKLLSKKHFSGRKTKLAHVNGMIGLNVSPEDKEQEVCRLNWIVRRSGQYNDTKWVTAAGCWAVMNPAVLCW